MSLADTYVNISNVLGEQGDHEKCLFHLQNALEIYERALGPSHASVADTKYNTALVYLRQGATAQARRLFGEAGAIYRVALGATHSKTLDALRQAQDAAPPHEADSEECPDDARWRRPACGRCVVA